METINATFVKNLIKEVSKSVQKISSANGVFKTVYKSEDANDGFHLSYQTTVDMHERIRVHAELQTFPKKLFRARAPRMTKDEEKYLEENYKQVTMPVYLDLLSTIGRIFHDANYNLTFKEEKETPGEEKTFQEYLENGLPEIGSLEVYMKSIFTHLKLTDANGVVAIRPKAVEYALTQNGELVVDETKLSEPIPIYFSSSQVLKDEPGKYMLLMSTDKSMVKVGDKNKKQGYVFEFYDTENVYRIEQTGKFEDWKFNVNLFFNHHWGKLPCIKMKGVPSLMNGKLVWISPFMYSVDLLDLVAVNSSYLQVVINNCVFPYRVMYGDECEYEHTDGHGSKSTCDMGYVYDSQLDSKLICPGCAGTGLKSRINPFGVMLIRTGNATGNSDKDIGQPPMAYVEPSIETPKFLMGKISDDEMKARRILHLNTSQSQVQGGVEQMNPAANTATGMITDLKALYAFVKPISDQIFEAWEFIMDAIGFMRYGEKYKDMKPTLTYPNTFDFYTETDYMNNIAMAVKSGMPPFVIQTILFKYLQSIFYNEKTTSQVFTLIYSTDRLLTMSNSDISSKQGRGVIEKWEAILHDSALTFVDQLMKENPKFFEQDFTEQQSQLIEAAKTVAENIVQSNQSEIAQQASNNIDGMLQNIAQRKANANAA